MPTRHGGSFSKKTEISAAGQPVSPLSPASYILVMPQLSNLVVAIFSLLSD